MKILENKYPLGSLPGQKTPGRYIDKILYENIKILAKNVKKDMTFLGIISSSTLEVGTGKSVVASQIGEAWTSALNEYHKFNVPFNMQNVVFSPKELIKRSFEVPRYSAIILDEWEDSHYWSELGLTLRQFFRKCRQLNLFIILIIPNFFQLPMSYAISRSVFFMDVRFTGEFERGYFSFYNFQKKKVLYLKGKKQQDYHITKPNFTGRFADGYAVNEREYRIEKMKDLIRQERQEKKPMTEKQIHVRLFKRLHTNLPELSVKRLSEGFGISDRTGFRYLEEKDDPSEIDDNDTATNIINNLMNRAEIPDKEGVEGTTEQ